jgi:hypothetical protein
MNSNYSGVDRIARHWLAERQVPTRPIPRPPRRTRFATTLRRVADRLDPLGPGF